ncbi:nucleotide sugar dehydrogenase [Streptomyces sp. NPDC059740]|uniref:nucleotide sugar dehydrogenase n=1 Tax=Streptomyces sp. NPDC059740 TaxID=3346926 RepID=UPI0036658088
MTTSAPRPTWDADVPTATRSAPCGCPPPSAVLPAQPTAAARAATVAVMGLGYVGLPTALALRAAGAHVLGVDVREERLREVRAGRVDLPADGRAALAAALRDGELALSTEAAVLTRADAVLICVPTPVDAHRVPDLGALRAACATAVARARPGQLLVLTSTVHVGATRELLVEPLARRGLRVEEDVYVAFAPERIDPGNPDHTPERTPRVVGGAGPRSTDLACALLAGTAPTVHRVADPETAEMAKLWENTFRAVNIALANELSDACEELGLAPMPVIEAAATKPYGFMPFYPGPGVGGHCIPCDPHYLLWQLRSRRAFAPVVESTMAAIAARPGQVVRRARELLAARGTPPAGARVLVVGLSYKPGVADVRESPALEIVDRLADLGADVGYLDPLLPSVRHRGRELRRVTDPAAADWDLVLIHTVQPGTDLSALPASVPVLDTTHRSDRRLAEVPA